MLVEALRRQWDAHEARVALHCVMTFEGDELVLGAGTKLARIKSPRNRGDEAADKAGEARLIALLGAAYEQAPDASALTHVRGALVKQSEGETALALIHLALTGLPRLRRPVEDARRLFMADALMKRGVAPQVILQAMELDPEPVSQLERGYNPDQPRIPAGSGRESGQWTSEDSSSDTAGDDQASATSGPQSRQPQSDRGIQVADASTAWLKYLDPIDEAQAGQEFNGNAPNDQHQRGVDAAIGAYLARGFVIESEGPVYVSIPGFPTGRYYDFVVRDPVTGGLIGIEVKTTLYDTIFFDESQVDKDVALLRNKGVFVPSLDGKITAVAYEAFCTGCSVINLGKAELVFKLIRAGIPIRAYSWPGGTPPI